MTKVTNIINPEGKVAKSYDYDEFGDTKESDGTKDNGFKNDVKFSGAVHDASSGLYYMNSRFYNPNTGRFLTQDTYSGNAYEPWTQHLYSYCSNNPVNFIDPTGHQRCISMTDGGGGGGNTSTSGSAESSNGYAPKKGFLDRVVQVAGGGALAYMGYAAITAGIGLATVATGGTALLAFAAIASIAAGAGCMAFGACDVVEGITDYNPIKSAYNKLGFSDDAYYGTEMILSAGACMAVQYKASRTSLHGEASAVQEESQAAKEVAAEGAGNAYANFAKQATKNANSTEVVLGKFNQDGVSYVKVAQERGATYFELDNWDSVVKEVGESNIWNINKSFLQQQANAGKNFMLSHDPAQATGYYAKEVNSLKEMGYNFVKDGSIWRAQK